MWMSLFLASMSGEIWGFLGRLNGIGGHGGAFMDNSVHKSQSNAEASF
jgi:hypothetical protein